MYNGMDVNSAGVLPDALLRDAMNGLPQHMGGITRNPDSLGSELHLIKSNLLLISCVYVSNDVLNSGSMKLLT